jgi:PAS domain S-box-containing protein
MTFALVVYGSFDRFVALDNLAEAVTTFVLLISGLVVYRIFRERYLFFWLSAWSSYLLYLVLLDKAHDLGYSPGVVALTYTAFLISCGLFAAAVFEYLGRWRWFALVVPAIVLAMAVATLRAFRYPQSDALEFVVQVLYRAATFGAAFRLAMYSRGRGEISKWMMAGMLLLIHIDFNIAQPRSHEGFDTLVETLLGLSMLVLLLDESRSRTRRLAVVQEITNITASAQDTQSLMLPALIQLKKLVRAKAAWFRLLTGDALELQAEIGLSPEFQQARPRIPAHEGLGQRIINEQLPVIQDHRRGDEANRTVLVDEGFDHIIEIPLHGKTAVIGVIAVGIPYRRRYKADELTFLASLAKQLGIAIENQQLISKTLRSQRQWANTFDALPDPILVHDHAFNIMKVNRSLLNKIGSNLDAVVNRTCEATLPHFGSAWSGCPYCVADPSEFRDTPDACFGGYSIVSTTTYTADDTGVSGTVHIIRDTTARRAAEERYRTLFEQVREGVFVSTPDGRVVDCNDAFVHLLGYENRDELLAKTIAQSFYVNPTDRIKFTQQMEREGMVRNFEVKLRRRDGTMVTVLENSYATKTASGNIIRYHGVLLDVTDMKKAEDEIRRRNRELEALNAVVVLASQSFDLDEIMNLVLRHLVGIFQSDTAAIMLCDQETRTLRRCAAFGHKSELGSNLPEIRIPDDFWEKMKSSHMEIVTDGDLAHLPESFTAFVRAERLRSWLWVIMWSGEKLMGVLGVSSRTENAYNDRDRGLLIALGRQLANSIEKVRLYEETSKAYDDLQRTQEQLLQSEKMSAVGQLISGVAHELNNPLTAILGYSQLLEGENLSESAREYVAKLFKQAQRTQRVVQNLLSFARQRKPSRLPVDVRRILDDTLALRDYDLNLNNIKVVRKFADPLPPVIADAHQLEQVFLNIVNNAVDAMLEHSRTGTLQASIAIENSQVVVRVQDSGPGIREINRIFDPFYTTKAVGKGTGLGLSICYGIIKEHGGDIRAFNAPEGGGVLEVLLPMAAMEKEGVDESPQSELRTVPLHGRVLLVDDEPVVLEFERDVLIGAGAEVVCMRTPEEAMEAIEREHFDAIVLDSTMPGPLSGIGLYRWIIANQPEYKDRLILAFSNLNEPNLKQVLEEDGVPGISKPFEVSELITVMSRAMVRRKSEAAV